nr:phage capsid protein [uncultured Mediterranean phage uvMED]
MAAAVNYNWGTSPDASVFGSAQPTGIASPTRLATSAPFARYLYESLYERSLFVQSGVLATDSRLNNITGTRVELPFFDIFDPTSEVVNSSATWGDNSSGYYTSQRITASTQYAPYCTRGFMHSMDDLSKYQTNEDALAHIRTVLTEALNKHQTQKLVSQLEGIFETALADNSLDVSEATAGSEDDTNMFSLQNVINAQYLLGEHAQELSTIVVHPKVAAQLQLQGQLTFSSPAGVQPSSALQWGGGGIGVSNTTIGFYNGFKLICDSQVPVLGASGENAQYVSYMFGDGVIRTGSQFPILIETERNIASLQDSMAVTTSQIHHIIGTSWKAAKDHPTNTDLATAGNWELAYTDHRNIHAVRLVSNANGGILIP